MSTAPETTPRWECPACLLEFDVPYCDCCGATLTAAAEKQLRGDALLLATVGHPLVTEADR